VHSPSPFLRAQGIVTVPSKGVENVIYPVPPPRNQLQPLPVNFYTAAQASTPAESTATTPPISKTIAPSNESLGTLGIGSSIDSITGGSIATVPNLALPEPTPVTNHLADHGPGSVMDDVTLPKSSPSPLSIVHDDLQCMEDMIPFAPTPPLPTVPVLLPSAPVTTPSTNPTTISNSSNTTTATLTLMEAPQQSTLSGTIMTTIIPIQTSTSTSLPPPTTITTNDDSSSGTKGKQPSWTPKSLTQKKLIQQQKEMQQRIQNQMQQDQNFQHQLQHSGHSLPIAGSTNPIAPTTTSPSTMVSTVLPQLSSLQPLPKPNDNALHQSQPQYREVPSSSKVNVSDRDGSDSLHQQSKPDDEGVSSYPTAQMQFVPPTAQHLSVWQANANRNEIIGSQPLSSHTSRSTGMGAKSTIMTKSSSSKPGTLWPEESVSVIDTVKSTKHVISKVKIIPQRPYTKMTTSRPLGTVSMNAAVQNQQDFYNIPQSKTSPSQSRPQGLPVPKPKSYQKKQLVSSRAKSQQHSVMPSAKMIADSIPSNASAVFHIFDRRINLDNHDSNSSFYSLLRSWVQDDPYRNSVHSGSRLLDHVSLSPIHREETNCIAVKKKKRNVGMSEVDVLLVVKKGQFESSSPDRGRLLFDHVKRAKRRKLEVQREIDEKMKRSRKCLKGIGIFL
jgi:hypothetical protein